VVEIGLDKYELILLLALSSHFFQVSALVPGLQQKIPIGDDVLYCSNTGPVNDAASVRCGQLVRGPGVVLFAFGVRGKVLYCLLRPGIS
jgi:hypothetical protein